MDKGAVERQYEALLDTIAQAMEVLSSQMAEAARQQDLTELASLSRQRKALDRFQQQLIKAFRRWQAEW